MGILIMALTTTTTFMILVLPTPEEQIGPTWAQNIVTAFQRVDLHDHTTSNGVKITPAGMLINSSLDFVENNILNLGSATLADDLAADAVPTKLYRVGADLYYNNSSGTSIRLTSGGLVNATGTGAITASTPGAYPYTVLTSDAQKVLLVDTSAARTLTLPAATNPMFVRIKDSSGTAAAQNITVAAGGSDTIDGAASVLINSNYGQKGFVSDGVSAWYLV